jgi:hypothetical protein
MAKPYFLNRLMRHNISSLLKKVSPLDCLPIVIIFLSNPELFIASQKGGGKYVCSYTNTQTNRLIEPS